MTSTAKSPSRHGTLCYLLRPNQLLLAQIDYGQGSLLWNGLGGYLKPNETPTSGVIREVQEEIGVTLHSPHPIATHAVSPHLTLHIFTSASWTGTPSPLEPSLLQLQWFTAPEIPYPHMHPESRLWLPNIINAQF